MSVEYARKVRDGDPLAGARTYVFLMAQSSNTTMEKGDRCRDIPVEDGKYTGGCQCGPLTLYTNRGHFDGNFDETMINIVGCAYHSMSSHTLESRHRATQGNLASSHLVHAHANRRHDCQP